MAVRALTYGSLCSGIEGASVAFKPLGWELRYVAEVDPFCCRVLEHHYKDVPNYGDITAIRRPAAADIVVGGTPCQSFSVTGLRKGLDDPRGNLSRAFCRVVADAHPQWFIWENVPGAMSTERGRGFGSLLRALVECGYRIAWRVLDSIRFGVPQRRRRVFVVGHSGDWRKAAAVLFDRSTCSEALGTSRKVWQGRHAIHAAPAVTRLGFSGDETPKWQDEATPTLRASQGGEGVCEISETTFSRLTPVEWERLQGFPDGYTDIPGAGVRQRMHALGNSFAVPVIRWIGQRIEEVESWQ